MRIFFLAVRLGEAYVRAGDVREWGGRDLRAKLLFPREASLLRFFLQQRVPDVGTVLPGDVLRGAQGRAGALQPCVKVRDCQSRCLLLLLAGNFARLSGVHRCTCTYMGYLLDRQIEWSRVGLL